MEFEARPPLHLSLHPNVADQLNLFNSKRESEAKQFKTAPNFQEVEALVAHLYKREHAIQSLACEIQAYKHRMLSFGLQEPDAHLFNLHNCSPFKLSTNNLDPEFENCLAVESPNGKRTSKCIHVVVTPQKNRSEGKIATASDKAKIRSLFHADTTNHCVGDSEINEIYGRLQALESDRESMVKAMSSVLDDVKQLNDALQSLRAPKKPSFMGTINFLGIKECVEWMKLWWRRDAKCKYVDLLGGKGLLMLIDQETRGDNTICFSSTKFEKFLENDTL